MKRTLFAAGLAVLLLGSLAGACLGIARNLAAVAPNRQCPSILTGLDLFKVPTDLRIVHENGERIWAGEFNSTAEKLLRERFRDVPQTALRRMSVDLEFTNGKPSWAFATMVVNPDLVAIAHDSGN